MVNDWFIPTKWLFHWGYTPFSDIPMWQNIRFLRMKRAASPQSLGGHGGHRAVVHFSHIAWRAVEAMSSVVKLSDPNLAVHPVLETLCDIMWKLRWTLDSEGTLDIKNGVKIRDQFVPVGKYNLFYTAVALRVRVQGCRGIPDVWYVWSTGESLQVESTFLSKLSGVLRTKNRHV